MDQFYGARSASLAGAPYLVACVVFAISSGLGIIRWTVLSMFQHLYESIRVAPGAFGAFTLLLAFLPIALERAAEGHERRGSSTEWFLLTAAGLTLMVYPRFSLLQAVGAVPCLAVGAASLLRRSDRLFGPLAYALVGAITVSTVPLLVASNRLDGVVVFWNDQPALNALVGRLRRLPPGTRVHSEIWENILPQSRLLPPGTFYAHLWLMPFIAGIDSASQRIQAASESPGTVVVRFGASDKGSSLTGPYVLENR